MKINPQSESVKMVLSYKLLITALRIMNSGRKMFFLILQTKLVLVNRRSISGDGIKRERSMVLKLLLKCYSGKRSKISKLLANRSPLKIMRKNNSASSNSELRKLRTYF